MKQLVSNRRKMEELVSVVLNEECLSTMRKLPKKYG